MFPKYLSKCCTIETRQDTRHLNTEENQLNAIQQRVNRRDILVNMKTIHDENRPLFKRTNMIFLFCFFALFFSHLKVKKTFAILKFVKLFQNMPCMKIHFLPYIKGELCRSCFIFRN